MTSLGFKALIFLNRTRNIFGKKFIALKNMIHIKSKMKLSFKSLFRLKHILNTNTMPSIKGDLILSKSNLILNRDIFNTLIKINGWSTNEKLLIHHSFRNYYHFTSSNLSFVNLSKIFILWNNILLFITNVFFFRIDYLVFSNTYFKYETLALNWSTTKYFRYIWKYSTFFIFFLNNKTTFSTESFFRSLISNNLRLSFVVDLHYHRKSLFYLNKFKFISVGPVPLSSNLYILSLALPVSSNSTFSNLFFFRFLLKIKKFNSNYLYKSYL
jgi:hypothetical protein